LNPAAEKIFSRSRAKLIGENVLGIIATSLHSWFQIGLKNCFAGDKGPTLGSRVEIPALRADGSEVPIEASVSRSLAGGTPQYTVILRDITARKRAEEEAAWAVIRDQALAAGQCIACLRASYWQVRPHLVRHRDPGNCPLRRRHAA